MDKRDRHFMSQTNRAFTFLSWLLCFVILGSCQPPLPVTQESGYQQVTLPPTWTLPPASPTTSSPDTPSVFPTESPAHTPDLPGHQNSTWMINIDKPTGWYSAEYLVDLGDSSLLAVGKVSSNQNKYSSWRQHTIWIARLTTTGEMLWSKTIEIPGNDRFFPHNVATGPDGTGLISGRYSHYSEEDWIEDYSLTFLITKDGQIQWKLPRSAVSIETLADSTILIGTARGASFLNPLGEMIQQYELDFGAGFSDDPYSDNYPSIEIAHHMPDGGLLFMGTIFGQYWGESSPASSGFSEGDLAYWYARIAPDGQLLWMHLHPVNPLNQRVYSSLITPEDHLIITGYEGTGTYSYSSTWVRKVDPKGETVFHKRFLDQPSDRDGLAVAFDGGILLWGNRRIPQEENLTDLNRYFLTRLSPDGTVEWTLTFPDNYNLNSVLPLSDGTYLLSMYFPVSKLIFIRLDSSGQLGACPDFHLADVQMRVDQAIPLFDTGTELPLTLSSVPPEEMLDGSTPPLSLRPAELLVNKLCRNIIPKLQ